MINELISKVTDIVQKLLDRPDWPITTEMDLISNGLSSVNMILLVVELEELFDIVFEDYELFFESFSTVQKIAELITRKVE
ncbi:acyl carrier protein [Paenibacillus sp. FSL K6-2524]|uniref:acyl carrier protein n=1 Tax=Paenibacillus sp. FSL K6-2524 TaxID=2954516 RepID=UPI0030FA1780